MTMTTKMAKAASPDVHEMVVIHRVFRREFAAIPRLVRRVPAKATGPGRSWSATTSG